MTNPIVIYLRISPTQKDRLQISAPPFVRYLLGLKTHINVTQRFLLTMYITHDNICVSDGRTLNESEEMKMQTVNGFRVTARFFESQADTETFVEFVATSDSVEYARQRFDTETNRRYADREVSFTFRPFSVEVA